MSQAVARADSATPRRAAGTPGLEPLRQREARLEAEWARLQRAGFGFTGVRSLLAGAEAGDEQSLRLLRVADAAQARFLDSLDEFQRLQHAHFMDQVVRELERAVETMAVFYGPARMRGIARAHRRLARLAARYRALECLYGTARDHRRIAVYQRFYAGVVAFSNRIRRLDPTLPSPEPRSLVDRAYRARRFLVWLVTCIPWLLALFVTAVRLLATVLARRKPGRGTPFTNRVDDLFRAWGRIRGHRVGVSGAEDLADDVPEGGVRLLTPAHRHGVTDNVTFSHLRLPDYLVFNAVDQLPLPRFLKDRVADTNGLVAVGGGRGPSVDRALEALGSGVTRNVLIYPEGSVSEGFCGTRPPREGFGDSLVRRIREAGHAIEVVPITYLDNARFLDLPPRSRKPEDRRLRVVVSPSLDARAVDTLLAAGGGAMVNRMVRLCWLENLASDERRFLGMDRVREVEKRLDQELDGIRYWGSLESPPAADLLETEAEEAIRVSEEPFLGKRVRVFRIPDGARDAEGRIPLRSLRSPDSSELLIGIRPPSHIYLNVGRHRFDGDIFRRLAVKDRDTVPPGIVIRFTGVPIKSINAIRRELESFSGREQRTLTCANSACKLIARSANMRIDDHADLRPFLPSHVLPTRTIRKLIDRGVRNHAGDLVEVQIYKSDDRSLETILGEARREEIRIARAHLEMITAGIVRALRAALRRLAQRIRSAIARARARRRG